MLERKIRKARYAMNGLKIAWLEESSFKLQVITAALVLVFGFFFEISLTEWTLVVFMMGFVLAAEVFNTALEELCDKFKTDPDPHIAKIKDLAAAAVFIASSSAFVVGVIIFAPYIADFL